MKKENERIRYACRVKGLQHYKLAWLLGMSEDTFCRKLRRELPEEEQNRILKVIEEWSEDDKC